MLARQRARPRSARCPLPAARCPLPARCCMSLADQWVSLCARHSQPAPSPLRPAPRLNPAPVCATKRSKSGVFSACFQHQKEKIKKKDHKGKNQTDRQGEPGGRRRGELMAASMSAAARRCGAAGLGPALWRGAQPAWGAPATHVSCHPRPPARPACAACSMPRRAVASRLTERCRPPPCCGSARCKRRATTATSAPTLSPAKCACTTQTAGSRGT